MRQASGVPRGEGVATRHRAGQQRMAAGDQHAEIIAWPDLLDE